jgi:RNA polymerase sigma factor (sigma-70 family)
LNFAAMKSAGKSIPTLESIYCRHLNMIFRICSRYCKDKEEAEDLAQDTFIKIDKHLPSFRGNSELSTWIYRLTTNCCLDHLRKRKSRNALYAEYLDSLVVRNLNSGGDRVLAKVDLDRILRQFRPEVRQILFLTLAEGLSYREAGEVMSVSKDAVAKTVVRFLKKYRSPVSDPSAPSAPLSTIPPLQASKAPGNPFRRLVQGRMRG